MNEKPDTTETLLTEVLSTLFPSVIPTGEDYRLALLQRLRAHCYRLGQHPPAVPSVNAGEQRWFRDLLAVIHRDGGHHTEKVGTEQSAIDASRIASSLLRQIDDLHMQLANARDELAELRVLTGNNK